MKETLVVNSDISLAEAIRELRKRYLERRYVTVEIGHEQKRTLTQNASLHLWCEMLADELNAAGLDMRTTLKAEVEIPWCGLTVKKHLWKPVQELVISKLSTADADRVEYTKVLEVMERYMASSHGITVPEWPSKESKNKQERAA